MNPTIAIDIEAWEDGGSYAAAARCPRDLDDRHTKPGRVGRAHQAPGEHEFDRAARSFRSVAGKQGYAARADTETVIGILEEKRAEVMRREQTGYLIRDWQEIGDQVPSDDI